MKRLLPAALLTAVALALACSSGKSTPAPAPSQAATAAATPAGNRFSVEDPAGDCLSNQNSPIACEPAALDMKRFTIDRDAAGNVVAVVEISGGYQALGAYTLLMGFDTDRNAATGNTSYAAFHGLAPDVELAYIVRAGQQPLSEVRIFPGPGQRVLGDAGLVEWRLVDPVRMQVTVKPAAIGNATSFWVVTDLNIADRYDHMPDNARVSFPEGRVLPK